VDARLSSVPYADLRAANVGTVADAKRLFGINLAVTGALRSRGSALQLRLRLLDASTGRALREQEATLDGDLSALARPLASLLDMPAAGAVAPSANAASIAPGAYEFYAQGQGYLLRSGERDIDSAIDLLRRAVDTQPTFALAQAALARAYAKHYQRAHDAGSADRAQQAAAEALRLDPSLPSAHAASGMVLRQTGRREEAVRAFQSALQHDGQDADVLNQLANTYDELGDPLRAEETFQRAIRANPGYWVGYNNLGRFYLQHRQFDQARQQFRWATELAPDNPRAHSNLGGLYLALGDYANAQTTLQRAYALQPTAAICSNLGTASLALGDTSRAQRMFEQAVSLAPRDHRYRRNLGDAYAIAGRLADARAAWTQAATMIEGDTASAAASADLYATAALYRAKLRETAATRRWLVEAVRLLRPDDAGAQLKIAQAQELIGDRDAALATLARAIGAGLARAEIDQSAELAQLRQDRRYAPLASPLAIARAAVAP
jgi:Flp pilus assembly protein TadD